MQIKTLLKKGLTGEEIGILLLKNRIKRLVSFITTQKEEELFTVSEEKELRNSLTENEHIKAFNEIISISNYVMELPHTYNGIYANVKIQAFYIFSIKHGISHYQEIKRISDNTPKILTEKEYKEYIKNQREEKLNNTTTPADIVYSIVIDEMQRLEEGKETQYKAILEQYKKEPLTRERLLNNYCVAGNVYILTPDNKKFNELPKEKQTEIWKEFKRLYRQGEVEELKDMPGFKEIEDNKAPEGTTKFEVLEYLDGIDEGFYDITLITEFKEDYPALFEAILKDLLSYKELSLIIKELPLEDYSKLEISYKDLYKIGYYKNYIDDNNTGEEIAIIQNPYNWHIDKEGKYINENINNEAFKPDTLDNLEASINLLKSLARQCYSLITAGELIGSFYNIPEIKGLFPETPEDIIYTLNDMLPEMYKYYYGDYMFDKNIKIKELLPSPQAITTAKQALKDKSWIENNQNLHWLLLEGQLNKW